ncbi:MAG TPA: glycosyltransferase family 9 protein [Bacteroidia bacterium]|jgi:heptosyltransferase-3|nr:glycosyltransferase family 9 protein [Bacteroidia bacterium]
MPGIFKSTKPVIIISRTDNIGDVVLTLPLVSFIRKKYPQAQILFLARKYLRPLLEADENINKFIDWDEVSALPETFMQIDFFKKLNADAIIHVFPNLEVAWLAKKAGIRIRIGTSHRSYHWLYCNKLINFSRKNSPLHEAQLNFKLAKPLGLTVPEKEELKNSYGLSKLPKWNGDVIDKSRFNLIIHPKSRGSAREWDMENFSKLINILPKEKFKIFVTGTEDEGKIIREKLLKNHPEVTDMTGKMDFSQFIAFISATDGLIAASTGPLHIAAALGKKVVGLFPSIRPMHAGRWAPQGPQATYLALEKDCTDCKNSTHCACINSITPEQVKELLLSISSQD